MRVAILNESHYPTEALGVLVDFVAQHFDHAHLAYVHITTKKKGMSDGCAVMHDPTDHGRAFFAPSRIHIDLVDRTHETDPYPLTTIHHEVPEAVGHVWLESPEEEFIFVLAHELQHVSQWWNGEEADEVDAERKALKVLKKFRKLLT